MPRVDPLRHRSAVMNFRVTPAIKRYIYVTAREMHENVSDFIREAIKLRIEIRRTWKDVAEEMGYKEPETMVWHAVQEYARRHAPEVSKMPAMPEEEEQDATQG